MFIDCDLQKLNEAFEHFIQATGVYASLLNEDFSYRLIKNNPHNKYCERIEACSEGICACRESDRKLLECCRSSQHMEMHVCHAGLVDVSATLLRSTVLSVEQVSQQTGFSGTAYFSRLFKKRYGIAPLRYRKQQKSTANY